MHVVTFGPSPLECRRSSRCALLTRGVVGCPVSGEFCPYVHFPPLFCLIVLLVLLLVRVCIPREPPPLFCLLFDCDVGVGGWRMNLLVGGTAFVKVSALVQSLLYTFQYALHLLV